MRFVKVFLLTKIYFTIFSFNKVVFYSSTHLLLKLLQFQLAIFNKLWLTWKFKVLNNFPSFLLSHKVHLIPCYAKLKSLFFVSDKLRQLRWSIQDNKENVYRLSFSGTWEEEVKKSWVCFSRLLFSMQFLALQKQFKFVREIMLYWKFAIKLNDVGTVKCTFVLKTCDDLRKFSTADGDFWNVFWVV